MIALLALTLGLATPADESDLILVVGPPAAGCRVETGGQVPTFVVKNLNPYTLPTGTVLAIPLEGYPGPRPGDGPLLETYILLEDLAPDAEANTWRRAYRDRCEVTSILLVEP